MSGFFTELKRRKVVRVAVVYLATAFAVLEAAEIVLPRLAVPEWTMTLIVLFTMLGFPIAVVLGWALEVTPSGIRRTESAAMEEPAPALLGKRTLFVAALLVAVGVGLGAGWLLRPPAAPIEAGVVSTAAAPSIAVLPFVNMSADADNEYFSDGISEELLNLLAKVPGLQVAARTSSFAFKNRSEDAIEIGQQLRVGHVLEGSVRRSGDRVRITAQLIEAEQGYHLWSEAYDRDLVHIFAVQDEIARAIVAALETELGVGGAAVLARAPATGVPRAHDLYLLGLRDWYRRGDASLRSALERFGEAARLDPAYAPAHAGMALTYSVLPMYGQFPVEEAVREGRASVQRALELSPDLPEAHAALGQIAQNWEWDWATAEQAYDRALELNPNHATAHMWRCELLTVLGRTEESLRACRRGLALDPLAPIAHNQYASALLWGNQPHAAPASFKRAVELDPELQFAVENLRLSYLLVRDFDRWLHLSLQQATTEEKRSRLEALHAGWTRPADPRARAGALAAIEAGRHVPGGVELPTDIVMLTLLGENEKALAALDRALAVPRLRPHLPYLVRTDVFADIAADRRFREALRQMNLEPYAPEQEI